MKLATIDLNTATPEELKKHEDFLRFTDEEGRCLTNNENMRYYLSQKLDFHSYLSYRSCISAFTSLFSSLFVHCEDGNMEHFFVDKVDIDKFIDKFKAQIEKMEETTRENSKNNNKETLN